jgi:quercetin dioxygenase-like cupin family protein
MDRVTRAASSFLLGVALLMSASTFAADNRIFGSPKDLNWGAAPPTFPKGAKVAVLHGDPGAPGLYVLRLRVPSGYRIAPHSQPQDRQLTVLSGAIYLGYGDTWDPKHTSVMKAGGFHTMAADQSYFGYTKGETIVQIEGQGPFELRYVRPGDNPQTAGVPKPYYFPSQYKLDAPEPGEPVEAF